MRRKMRLLGSAAFQLPARTFRIRISILESGRLISLYLQL
jgi:hypothetical protein